MRSLFILAVVVALIVAFIVAVAPTNPTQLPPAGIMSPDELGLLI